MNGDLERQDSADRPPPLSPAHGTSLGTTAGITAVISIVIAAAVLAQCGQPTGPPAELSTLALVALMLGSGGLYAARNQIGRALDLSAIDPVAAGLAAARGLTRFHLGMAGVFGGAGLAASFHAALSRAAIGWLIPATAAALTAFALMRAAAWAAEARRRGQRGARAAAEGLERVS